MTALPPNVTPYRDRHGKQRWRYRKGKVCVQIPGQPGDDQFHEQARRAAAGLMVQRIRRKRGLAHPARLGHLTDFAKDALARARYRASEKRVPFLLTLDDVRAVMEAQEWRCAISGVAFFEMRRSERAFQATLDRISPKAGYVAGNVRIVAYIVNVAMNQWGEAALWKLVETMAARLPGSQLARTYEIPKLKGSPHDQTKSNT